MLRTVKAKINKKGEVKLLEPIKIDAEMNAIVTVLDDEIDWSKPIVNETALLSEAVLSKYWDRPEEDEAWKDLYLAILSQLIILSLIYLHLNQDLH
ncbi:MAG: hypothetical protein M3R36_08305 [Bacteroidota bacterium]|nr:hypothetical protein [Bacteroidota bacterium]